VAIEKIDKLLGYVSFEDEEYPFEFFQEEFQLVLFPPTKMCWQKKANIVPIYESMGNGGSKEKKWADHIKIEGVTSEDYKIIFCVLETPVNYHGFKCYEVQWYYYCRTNFGYDKIRGLRIQGPEVNYFYSPEASLKKEIEFGENNRIEKMTVSAVSGVKCEKCGRYRIEEDLQAEIKVDATSTMYFDNPATPIDALSNMYIEFSQDVDVDTVVEEFYHVKCFFMYISYRTNVTFDRLETWFINTEGKRDFSGAIVFPTKRMKESNKRCASRILDYKILEDKTAKIFEAIVDGKMEYAHLCDSIDDMRQYSQARIIMILVEFEREFMNIYGKDYGRSEKYCKTKADIIDLIEQYRADNTGDSKRYAAEIKRTIEKLDGNSFAVWVKKALLDCINAMKTFIALKYDGDQKAAIEHLSKRVGEIRNGIAHGNIDFEIKAIHLTDLEIIEEVTYAIRLKYVGVSDKNISKGIKNLFNVNIDLTETCESSE